MAATPPSNSKSAGDDRNLVPVNETTAVTFEEKFNLVWQRNRTLVLGLVAVALLAVVAKLGWDYIQQGNEQKIEKAYAAATTPAELTAFAAAHPDHALAGIAHLRMADDAFAADKPADAVAEYDKALTVLKDNALVARIRLGRAVAQVQLGKTSEATADLKQLANDASQLSALRAEAAYDLASIAATAHNADDVQKYTELVQQIDGNPMSNPWLSRAMALRAALPAMSSTAKATGGNAAPAAKQDEAPKVELKLPGK